MADPGRRLSDDAVQQRLSRIDEVVDVVEQTPGPTAEAALEGIQCLLEVYGEALARVVDVLPHHVLEQLTGDELLAHLLVLHDLHPATVEDRVRQVLDELRPQLESRGGELELVGIDDGIARVRLSGGGCGHSSGSAELEQAVADSVLALAPELGTVESVHDEAGTQALIPVEALFRRPVPMGVSP